MSRERTLSWVYPAIKENAAIFSHPNPWAIIAECRLGRGSRAMTFYDALLPYNQNVVNYNMRMGIVGDFSAYTSRNLLDFIFESNKCGRIVFGPTEEAVLELLS